MGGTGVSGKQMNTAIGSEAGLATNANTQMQGQQGQYNQDQAGATGFYNNQMKNGLPFYNSLTDYGAGANAQAFAPQRAQLLRQTSQYGNMPSGYRDSLVANLGAQQGRSFDSTLVQNMMAQQMAKNQGAAGMQGQQQIAGQQALGYGGVQGNANQTVMSGPLKPTVSSVVGGIANSFAEGAGKGAGGAAAACWIAEAIFGEHDPRTLHLRAWLNGTFKRTWIGSKVMAFYVRHGEAIAASAAKFAALRWSLRPLFELALHAARRDAARRFGFTEALWAQH